MRKSLLIFGLLLFIWSLILTGCSDDDECALCPELAQKGIVLGGIELQGSGIYCWVYVVGSDGFLPDVDSVKFEGNDMELQIGYGEGGAVVYCFYEGSSAGYSSGDDVSIYYFTPAGTCSTTVAMLYDPDDEPEIIDWATSYPNDTVALGEDIEVHWHPVDNAEWYHLEFDYSFDSLGSHAYRDIEAFTTDTTFTIPGSESPYNGYYYLYITPVNGPRPDATEGNVMGTALNGIVTSIVYYNFRVYVGNGDAWPVGIAPDDELPENPNVSEWIWNQQTGK